ncbi:hypothetical protein ACJX0J_011602, partial [Zea mays]
MNITHFSYALVRVLMQTNKRMIILDPLCLDLFDLESSKKLFFNAKYMPKNMIVYNDIHPAISLDVILNLIFSHLHAIFSQTDCNLELFGYSSDLMQKTGFDMDDVVRKYIRYTLNEKQFSPDVVVDLIHLRKASMLEDAEVAEILNEISRRIVREKGPVVMDLSGFTEQGFKRKLAVQALFGKILYLSELPEFCSRDSSLVVKEIFGVT